jgi:hypothetical protein
MNRIYTPDKDYFFKIKVNNPIVDSVDGTTEFPDALAMVSPFRRLKLGSDGEYHLKKGCIGLIQFKSKDLFKASIISHEAVHCATAYCRYFEPETLNLSQEDIDENEEKFADIVMHFTNKITDYYYDEIVGQENTAKIDAILERSESL